MTSSLKGLRVAVVGAGVFGLSIAVSAAQVGAQVVAFDPAPLGDNASGVAAGMVSPALEAALEGSDAARFALFAEAYARWPAFAARLGLPLHDHEVGAVQVGDAAMLDGLAARLRAFGAAAEPLTAAEVRARQPLYGGVHDGVLVGKDGRLEPLAMLAALAGRLVDAGGRVERRRLEPGARPASFDRLVIAAGYQAHAWAKAAPALRRLVPIKGQILRFDARAPGGPTLRGPGGYLVPQAGAVLCGASMETGRADLALDPAVSAALHRAALDLAPALAPARWAARAGVRAGAPDGLPLVGAVDDGIVLAVGARRNGWLLAPLATQAAIEALDGGEAWAGFDPHRFGALAA